MKATLITMLMLIGMMWVSCKKESDRTVDNPTPESPVLLRHIYTTVLSNGDTVSWADYHYNDNHELTKIESFDEQGISRTILYSEGKIEQSTYHWYGSTDIFVHHDSYVEGYGLDSMGNEGQRYIHHIDDDYQVIEKVRNDSTHRELYDWEDGNLMTIYIHNDTNKYYEYVYSDYDSPFYEANKYFKWQAYHSKKFFTTSRRLGELKEIRSVLEAEEGRITKFKSEYEIPSVLTYIVHLTYE
jgi:hypothetical protein